MIRPGECYSAGPASASSIGGGSTLGLAKILAAEEGAKFIALPTTYSGSEMTPIWGLTESGVKHSLQRLAPHKKFYFVDNENCNCSECPYMKMNTLEKLHACLRDLKPRVELPREVIERARVPIERMLAVKL